MRYCPKCGSRYSSVIQFCFKDGEALLEMSGGETSAGIDASLPEAESLEIQVPEDDLPWAPQGEGGGIQDLLRAAASKARAHDSAEESSAPSQAHTPAPESVPSIDAPSLEETWMSSLGEEETQESSEPPFPLASDSPGVEEMVAALSDPPADTAPPETPAVAPDPVPSPPPALTPEPELRSFESELAAALGDAPPGDSLDRSPSPRPPSPPQDGGGLGGRLLAGLGLMVLVGGGLWLKQAQGPDAVQPEVTPTTPAAESAPAASETPRPTEQPSDAPEVAEEAPEEAEAEREDPEADGERDKADREKAEAKRERDKADREKAKADRERRERPKAERAKPDPQEKRKAAAAPEPAEEDTPNPWADEPETLQLTINSQPPLAYIRVNGKDEGIAPVTLELEPGSHDIQGKLKGMTGRQSINLTSSKSITLQLAMKLQTFGAKGTKVYVDGAMKGSIPFTLNTTPGSHRFKLELQNGESCTFTKEIATGMDKLPLACP